MTDRIEASDANANRIALRHRRGADRGLGDHGWLTSRHTFSFSDYHDPAHMGFRNLRVINDDRVDAGEGFPTHAHRDMEILSYVLEGALEHKDSLGTGSVIRPGDLQRMSAGSGVRHSEFNASKTEAVHFLQIWIQPDATGIAPSYEQKTFRADDTSGKLRLIASKDGRNETVTVHADIALYAGTFAHGGRSTFELAPGRHLWLHVATGSIKVNDEPISAGDAVFTTASTGGTLVIEGDNSGEVLLFDLP
jgi:quercetin 2,3-dioxygenase